MKNLTKQDYKDAANQLGCGVANIKAVAHVESLGGGFLSNGKPKILFEGHQFWKRLKKQGKDPNDYVIDNDSILYPRWTTKHYRGGAEEYDRLEQAIAIDFTAAYESASYGEFQIMGFHWEAFGWPNVYEFVKSMNTAKGQLNAFVTFIEVNNLARFLRNEQWAEFAKRYNGPGYKKNNYDTRMASAFIKFK
tara:strand:+ start:2703 stop:3278 length:576 start_codon:yes stop_codon:yes gene_type:complete